MRIGIGTKGLVIIIVPFLFQIGFITVLVSNLKLAEEAARESARARMISGYTSAAVNLVATNTTVAAGYAMSKNERYRSYFQTTLEEVSGLMKQVKSLMVHPAELQEFQVFEHQVEELTKFSAEVVKLTEKGQSEQALNKVKDPSTDQLWGRARQAGGHVVGLENMGISRVDAMLLEARQSLSQTVIVGVVVDSVLMLVLLVFFSVDITRRLSVMMDNARLFAASKPLKKRVKGSDQISQLDAVFHSMADTVTASLKREKAVVDHAVDVICSLDEEGRFTAINPAAQSAWGYVPESLKGRNFLEVITPIDRENSKNAFETAKRDGSSVTFETEILVSASDVKDAEWVAYWSASDKALFCVVHDITERKKGEQILRENEARMRAILENMLVGVFVSDENGLIEIVNPRTEEMFGYSVQELTGKPLSKFLVSSPKSPREILETTKHHISELDARRQNGEVFPVEITTSEFETVDGRRLLTNVLDVSERKEVDRVRREFVAIVSHDLRTPLSGIVGGLNLLSEGVCGELPARAQEIVRIADRSASRLMSLVNDLLDIEKLEAGMMNIEAVPADIHELILSAVSDVETLADKSDIKIVIEAQTQTALADKDRIVRVLINLLANAIKFSPPSSQIIVSSVTKDNYVEVSVADSGRGIPEHFRHLLFQKFQQSENTDATKKGGTGLGLAICKAIVEQHRGTIGVDSTEGKGSRFWFRLPTAT